MSCSFADSVHACADESGNLSRPDAVRLLARHGFTLDDVREDAGGACPTALGEHDAGALLAWLGY